MIQEKIKSDLFEEFHKIRLDLEKHIESDFNITTKRGFLQNHVPNEVIHKSEVILDTLLNYLMEQAVKDLEKADIEIQNAFFDEDFRKRIRTWVAQLDNQLRLNPAQIDFSTDPRWKQAIIAGGTTFVIGAAATTVSALILNVVGAIVTGFATIIISAIAFKIAYDKATPKAREIIKSDIEKYLRESEVQIQTWLNTVIDSFSKAFDEFCSSKNYTVGGGHI